ncbi:1-aminocyclopropane-1-carboxylate deaminase/D-cysteine desulfhydrase [Stutzerimonas balearica]|uniref:1-aminocyclopropane-1-carboxylate deaminase/D-cysteine desulfhydrase n=1 Tax=Stutzerimonas balearica TaxID=74829 RepID=UPI0028ADEDB8|nr:pyridoxal-phosphate dependent enzyme [Stutzerimonas balearica]
MAPPSPYLPGAPIQLQPLSFTWLDGHAIELAALRLDQVDPELSGNKWFKLLHHLEAAAAAGAEGLISLGGPHSNHLHALAAAGRRFGLCTVGLLRGHPQDTPTVQDLLDCGMALHWLGYGGYRERYQPEFWAPWQARYPGFHCVPEGGGGLLGALGCAELVAELRQPLEAFGWGDYHGCWLAAGTGTTLAGLVLGEAGRHPVYGALAGPGEHAVAATVATLLQQAGRDDTGYRLFDASRRGFGRFDPELVRFMRDAEREGGMPLEPVYTAKAMMALREQVRAGLFAPGSRLVFVHTGGLQGLRGANLDAILQAEPGPGAAETGREKRPAASRRQG